MFCTKCGKEIEEGQVYCPGCGTKVSVVEEKTISSIVSSQSLSEEIISETEETTSENKKIEDKYVWPLACTPLLGYAIAFILLKMGIINSLIVTIIIIAINCVFLFLDINYLKSEGREPGNWVWLGLILVPVYLGVRANKTNKNFIPLIVEIVLLIGSSLFPNAIQKAEAELKVDKQLIENLEAQQWDSIGVHVSHMSYDIENNIITMDVNADDGSAGKYKVYYSERWEGNNIYVETTKIDFIE